ncbi:glycosyltransferase family 2 protein [Lactococcus lactis]|uniref:glycosyltransferase family 2 protein n=1 Tax=Lactococcus lactis TaxID=1358 RepID=UPI00288CF23A|nr:glycosyltransferase family A protein [Lactococcus lactis]MDT2905353.1 glycosyltransferase family A protein [Lactococcus lactis]MDT2909991.1 glycosyltransferase family A protein [Lactococcus lactis]MDT2931372.1 glycosyltransferase family A protein [Lactococcus lactis]MDT2936771.1 glycosyltransferase family A protein [Lactococcus lactis]
MKSKVSVIVTCFNHEDYIEECLRSIFSQTYSNIELFVFNDGSTDNSGKIIEQVLTESPFFETKYIYDENRGVVAVRNEGLRQFTGDYVLFVDSDNFLNNDHIEKLLIALQSEQYDIAYCQLWDFVREKNVLQEDLSFSMEKMLRGNLIDVSALIRAEKIKDQKFDMKLNNQLLEDYDFWLNLIINKQAKPIFVTETKLNYRVLSESRSSRGDWKKYYDIYFYILDKYITQFPIEISQAIHDNVEIWIEGHDDMEQRYLSVLSEKEQNKLEIKKLYQQKSSIEQQLNQKEQELQLITNSRSYKIGNILTHPLRKLKQVLKK